MARGISINDDFEDDLDFGGRKKRKKKRSRVMRTMDTPEHLDAAVNQLHKEQATNPTLGGRRHRW